MTTPKASHRYYFWPRRADGQNPAGWTVTKRKRLPRGDFQITEYSWASVSLWFLDADDFNADERQAAYEAFAEATT